MIGNWATPSNSVRMYELPNQCGMMSCQLISVDYNDNNLLAFRNKLQIRRGYESKKKYVFQLLVSVKEGSKWEGVVKKLEGATLMHQHEKVRTYHFERMPEC